MLESAPDIERAAQASGRFALDLYAKLRQPRQNLIFSPFSVFAALAMTLAGARGATAKEIAAATHLPPESGKAVGALLRDLAGGGAERGFELNIANALWGRAGYPFLPAFLQSLAADFGAMLRQTDFGQPAEACRAVNDWVAEETRGKIRDLLSPESINQLTQLILVNAVYFKGKWSEAFDKADTKDRPFHLPGGGQVQVPTMTLKTDLQYCNGGTFEAAQLLYRGSRIGMTIFLPAADSSLEAFERELTVERLAGWVRGMKREEVRIYLPRFQVRSSCDLLGVLSAMGMDSLFGEKADLTGMDGGHTPLALSAAVHQAFVDVNEEGTEAAAATAFMFETLSIDDRKRMFVFKVERPFLFLLSDRRTGAILFIGRVVNPVGDIRQ